MIHFYFHVDIDNPITKRLDVGKNRIADIQGVGTQVVGPNSQIGERKYKIVCSNPIKKVSYKMNQKAKEVD